MGALSIVLVPGAAALPGVYQDFVDAVTKEGFDIHALHLPSVGLESGEAKPGPPPTLQDDAAHVAKHVASLADAGRDVLLVTHSYGGAVGSESVKGLSKASRQEQGLAGGIVRIAYITSLVPALGQSPGSMLAALPVENQIASEVDENGWIRFTDLDRIAEVSFNHFPPEEGKYWAGKLVKHSGASFMSPLTYAGYKDVPVSYLFCEADRLIPPFVQQGEIDMIERETGKKVDVTRIDSDHVPLVSHPDLMIDWVVKLAKAEQVSKGV